MTKAWTKLLVFARNESASETPVVVETAFERERCYAEHKRKEMPEQSDATEFSVTSRLLES